MNITVIGASAGVGLLAVQQALVKDHRVTTLSRKVVPIADHPQLTRLVGSATSVADLKITMQGADAVLVTIGTKSKKATTLFSDTAKALIQAAAELSFSAPVLAITGFGIGASSQYLNLFMRLVIKGLLNEQSQDKARLQEQFADSPLRWEIVQPGRLTNGPLTQAYQVIPTLYQGIKIGSISRADVADFMLREAEKPTRLYHYVALTK